MKCENCGGNLSLEALRCPHCGTLNKHAQQHIRDMNYYQGEFEDTRKDVYTVTRNYAGITVRAGIITVLLILIVIFIIIASKSYEVRATFLEAKADRKYDEYSAIMDEYIAEENYMAFDAFCNGHYIDGYDTRYESYEPIMRACRNYTYLYESLMSLYTKKVKAQEAEVPLESEMDTLANQLEYFYEVMDMEHYTYYEGADTAENRAVLEQMQVNVKALLHAYCGLTEEDLVAWDSLSNAKRRVLLEERMENAK